MNMKCNLKRSVALLAFGGLAALLSGCVVAPLGYEAYGTYPSGPVVVAPPPVVVAPVFTATVATRATAAIAVMATGVEGSLRMISGGFL